MFLFITASANVILTLLDLFVWEVLRFPVDCFRPTGRFNLGFSSHLYLDPLALDLGTKSEAVGFKM